MLIFLAFHNSRLITEGSFKIVLFSKMNSSTAGIHKWQHHNFTTAPFANGLAATDWHDSQVFQISCYFLMGLVAVLGLLGNGLVFVTITLRPHMKNVINYYIRNLAVADSLILLISLPLAIVKVEFIYDWPLGKFVCEVIVPLTDTFVSVSAWTITIIAIERHRAIVSYRYCTSLKYPRIALAITWVVSFSVGSLPLLIVTQLLQGNGYAVCQPMWPETPTSSEPIYIVVTSVVFYPLPLAVILWTYVSIASKIRESKRFNKRLSRDLGTNRAKNQCQHKEKRIKIVMKAKKIFTPVVVAFAVTMLPFYCTKMAIPFYEPLLSCKYFTVLVKICFLLVIVNSACNPIIYAIVCKSFRNEIKELLKCKLSSDHRNRNSTINTSSMKRRQNSSERSYV